MNKFLPKTFKNTSGFTLVELLVVIAIIAVLAAIGLTIFGNAQKNARDSRRQSDINAIADVMETQKTPGSATYPSAVIVGGNFSSGAKPADAVNGSAQYCLVFSIASATPAVKPTVWTNATVCPTAAVGNTIDIINAVSAPSAAANTVLTWYACALLENPTSIYCIGNQQ